MQFDIYGCCVSRDIFNYLDQEMYTPSVTLGGDIINSSVHGRKIEGLSQYLYLYSDSGFERRMLEFMANGDGLSQLPSGQWLIFDMANERFPLQEWSLNNSRGLVPVSWATYS